MKISLSSTLLRFTFLLLVLSIPFQACTPTEGRDKADKPNVILILADDLGWSDIGCYGSEVETPNLDKLAAGGIRFTEMYNTAKCFPSRACMLTGLYSQQTGYNTGYRKSMKNALTLGEMFKMAGYITLWSGKHHSTENPVTRGFDHYSGLFEGAANYFNPGKQREGEGKPAQKRPDRPWVIEGEVIQPYTPESKDFYATDVFTDYALGWMEQYKNDDRPFFLYMAYTAPHDPLMAWPEDIAKYEGKYKAGYEKIRKMRFKKQKKLGLLPENFEISAPIFRKWEDLSEMEKREEARKMEVYAAMTDRLDQNIGLLLEKLKENGEEENTLILFASDNGASAEVVNLEGGSGEIGSMTRWTSLGADWANVANTPLRYYKNYSHEGGIKTPLIAYWPKGIKKPGRVSHTPLHFIDFMSTFVDLTGVDYPKVYHNDTIRSMEGISFLPIMKNEKVERNKPLFWEWAKGQAIRDGEWKLVAYQGKWELYNLNNDPVEAHDLSMSNPEKVEELKSKYKTWALEVGIKGAENL